MQHVADERLNDIQRRVKACTLGGTRHFDGEATRRALAGHAWPAWFLDFETIQFTVPIWPGTRPYQQLPFQFSVHRVDEDGSTTHDEFLDLSGGDPSRDFVAALLRACGTAGPVFVYNATFEKSRISELAERFPTRASALQALSDRIVDLLPLVRAHYYHPDQQGSWSIKKVLPTIAPDLDYQRLEGVQDGGMAMEAYREAIAPGTSIARKATLRRQMLAYCGLDTMAMVRLWQFLGGRP